MYRNRYAVDYQRKQPVSNMENQENNQHIELSNRIEVQDADQRTEANNIEEQNNAGYRVADDNKMEDEDTTQEGDCRCATSLDEVSDADWLAAIVDNLPNKVQHILDKVTRSHRSDLLRSHFHFNDGHVSQHLQGSCFRLRLPLALAMAIGSHKIVEILIAAGADPCQQDCQANNVLHSMIMQIFYHPQLEDTVLQSFAHLVTLLRDEDLKKMLLAENVYNLRPLEFAAQHGSCKMMMAIMDIPALYLYRQERHGLTTYHWYDVTDYEASAERFAKHPLLLLTFVDEKIQKTQGYHELHASSLIMKWFDAKFKINIPFITLLLVFRVIYITCYIALDMDTSFYGNYTHGVSANHCRPAFAPVWNDIKVYTLRSILLFCAISVIVVDIIELCVNYKKVYWQLLNTVEGRKKWFVQVHFYRWSNILFSLFIIVYVVLGFFGCECFVTFYDISRVTCPILAVWNILYFFQLLPSIGNFVFAIQTILQDMLNFSIVYIIFMIPFMHSFQTVINTNTNVGCVESFDTMFRIAYSMFITVLNMIDYSSYDIRNAEVLLVAHVTYTFVVSIMMINFFIALLSDSVNRTAANKVTALCTQRSCVAMTMERRCQWLFTALYRRLKRYYFHYEDGRYFIITVK